MKIVPERINKLSHYQMILCVLHLTIIQVFSETAHILSFFKQILTCLSRHKLWTVEAVVPVLLDATGDGNHNSETQGVTNNEPSITH